MPKILVRGVLSVVGTTNPSRQQPETYAQAKGAGFHGTLREWRSDVLKRRAYLQPYEEAKANGYEGSMDQWKLEKPIRPRVSGGKMFHDPRPGR